MANQQQTEKPSVLKVHWAISYEAYGETRVRSLCGKSSGRVVNVATIEVGQNVTNDPAKVTCAFCIKGLADRPSLIREATHD